MRFVLGITRRFVSSTRSRARQNGLHILETAIVLLYIVSFPLIPPLEGAEFGAPRLTVQTAHADDAISIAFSPDGKQIAIGADGRTVHIINIFSGVRKLLTVEPVIAEGENVVGLSFSGSGDAVLAVGDHRAIFWDIETGQHTSYFRPKGG